MMIHFHVLFVSTFVTKKTFNLPIPQTIGVCLIIFLAWSTFFNAKKMHKLRCLFGHPKKVAIFWTTEKNHLLLIAAKSLLKKIWSCQSPGIIFVTQLQLPKLLGYFYFIKILRKYPQLRVGTAIKTNFWKTIFIPHKTKELRSLIYKFFVQNYQPFQNIPIYFLWGR